MKETVKKEKEESLEKIAVLRKERQFKEHQENIAFIQSFMQDYMKFFNNFVDHYEATKSFKISPVSIREWKHQLILGTNQALKDEDEEEMVLDEILDEESYLSLLKMKNEWKVEQIQGIELPKDADEDYRVEISESDNMSLNVLFESLYRLVYPPRIPTPPPSVYKFPLKIGFLGYDHCGKSELVRLLGKRFLLHHFKMDELIDEALAKSEDLDEKLINNSSTKKKKGKGVDFSPILLDDVEDLKITSDLERYDMQMGKLGLYIKHFQGGKKVIPDIVLANIVYIASAYLPLRYGAEKLNENEDNKSGIVTSDNEIPLGWIIEGFPTNAQQLQAINSIAMGVTFEERKTPRSKKRSSSTEPPIDQSLSFFDGLFAFDVLSESVINYCTHLFVDDDGKVLYVDDLTEINEKDSFKPFVDSQTLMKSFENYDVTLSKIENEGCRTFHQFSKENKEEMKNIRCVDYYEETEEQIFRILKNAELNGMIEERCKEMEVWDIYSHDIDEMESSLIKKLQSVEKDGDKDNQPTIEKKHYGIEAEEAQKLLELWEETDNVYNKAIKKCFYILKNNKQTLIETIYDLQDKFRKLIVGTVPINKKLHEFQKQFNSIGYELRANEQVKMELMRETTELRCSIYEILDQRREELFAEKKKIITSQLFKNVVSIVGSSYCDIVRVEIIRLRTIVDLINQYKGYLICETPVELLNTFNLPIETKNKGKTNEKTSNDGNKPSDKRKKIIEGIKSIYDVCAEVLFEYPPLNEAFEVAIQQADSINDLKDALLQVPLENLEEFAKHCYEALIVEKILLKRRLASLNYLSNCDFEAIEAQAKALEEYFNDLLIKQYLHDVQQVKGLVAHVIDHITDESPLEEALYFNNEHKLIIDNSKELSALPEPKELSWVAPVDDVEFSDAQLKLFMAEIRNFEGYSKKMVHIEELAEWMYKLSNNQTEVPILPGKYQNLTLSHIKKMLNSLNHKDNLIDWRLFVIRFLNRQLVCLRDDLELELELFIDFDGTKDSLRMPILIKDIFYELLADSNENITRTKLFLYLSYVKESSLESFKSVWRHLEMINGWTDRLSKQCFDEIINFAVEPLTDKELDRLCPIKFINFEYFIKYPFGQKFVHQLKRFVHKHYSIQIGSPIGLTFTTEDIHIE
eukprot:TRINITY_DN3233_c3_g6_i1.p1 TRINITY_DN3233_c3_g6~~TRINITY_DN3233_c3_g6_i1.p1  ORF type:complete len:1251 (+),score=385.58 TRINITY_DN3233_c3_g6_i1:321-3755(+)